MRVRAAAASSNAQDTLEVNRRRTSGSARCFPFPVDNFPIPKLKANSIDSLKCGSKLLSVHSGNVFYSTIHTRFNLIISEVTTYLVLSTNILPGYFPRELPRTFVYKYMIKPLQDILRKSVFRFHYRIEK
jgi:hypothetical protein